MTIHRVGPPEPEAKSRNVSLGRVLVTIDDLEALVRILEKQNVGFIKADGTPLDLNIEFDGGHFDDPEDLRRLSDNEALSLRLSSRNVQVILDPTQAVAIGDERAANEVYTLWARSRQTKARSRGRGILLSIAMIVCGIAIIVGLMEAVPIGPHSFVAEALLVIALVAPPIGVARVWTSPTASSFAEIAPYSMDEYRKNQSANKYPKAQTIVAIVAVIVAMVSAYAAWIKP